MSIEGTTSMEIVNNVLLWARSLIRISTDPQCLIVSRESLTGLMALKNAFEHSRNYRRSPVIVDFPLAG